MVENFYNSENYVREVIISVVDEYVSWELVIGKEGVGYVDLGEKEV